MGVFDEALLGRPLGASAEPQEAADCQTTLVGALDPTVVHSEITLCVEGFEQLDPETLLVNWSLASTSRVGITETWEARVNINFDGERIVSRIFDITDGEKDTFAFTRGSLESGVHSVKADIQEFQLTNIIDQGDPVFVETGFPLPDPALVTIPDAGCAVAPDLIGEGDLVEFTATIANENVANVSVSVTWSADGIDVITEPGVVVPGGSSKTVSQPATWRFVKATVGTGTFDVSADLSDVAPA